MKKFLAWIMLFLLIVPLVCFPARAEDYGYYAIVREGVNMRDDDGDVIKYLEKGTKVYVVQRNKEDKTRVDIKWNGLEGSVIKRGIKKISFSGSSTSTNSGKTYYAVTRYAVNLRDEDGNLICKIPRAALIKAETDGKSRTRIDVTYKGKKGTVLTDGVKKVKHAVFVDISSQKVTLIKGGKLITTSKCVTGTRNSEDTPKGMFKVTERKKNKIFKPSGKKSDYWLRFYGGCGFHDATWRSNWSSSAYKKSGSNGCVNLPHSFAKTLYNNAYKGMPVYIS